MIKETVGKFERMVVFEPGWDKRDPDPKKNYGLGSAGIKFLVRGEKGAIQFYLYAGWYPHLLNDRNGDPRGLWKPMPIDLGYHAYEKQYEGQSVVSANCPYLDGKPCYYDGSSLQADEPFKILVVEGEEALWQFLENEYRRRFGEA